MMLLGAFATFLLLLSSGFCYLYVTVWVRPLRIREKLRKQGINGPKPSILYGNIPEMRKIESEENARREAKDVRFGEDYCSIIFPYLYRWTKEYGPVFTYSRGGIQVLHVSHPDLVKEIGLYKSLVIGKPIFLQKERKALLGQGISVANGELWAHERKVIAPELFMNKVKAMVNLTVEAALPLMESWGRVIESGRGVGEIAVDEDLRSFSADVISRVCFGSNYLKGKDIFLKLRQLQFAMSKYGMAIGIPGMQYLPSKRNRDIWRLEREIRSLVLNVVKERKENCSSSSHKDLLQSIIEGMRAEQVAQQMTDDVIVDNCKNIYFAGHETTATAATWCLLLLAAHPEWQDRARAEAEKVLDGQLPKADMLSKMKTLTMVIQETLRLYPPSAFVVREAFHDLQLGELDIPKSMNIWIPISMLHHDPSVWGLDSDEFNPARFSNGVLGACKLPHMYIPFGIGSRTCVGQNLAMVELKIILSLLLSKFRFCLSYKYVHCPAFRLTIEPGFGAPLFIERV